MNDLIITERSRSNLLILTLSLVHLLLGLDINIVSISLPTIADHFNINPGSASGIVWIYFLVLTCFLPAFGKLGDIKGFRLIYIIGIGVFTIGSLLCGLSFSFISIITFRIIEALGAAVLFALTPAIISTYLPENIRGKAFGINYTFVALGGVIGRACSGYLITQFGWSSIFFINIPIGIIALLLSLRLIPSKQPEPSLKKFDLPGSVIIFFALFLFLYGVNRGTQIPWLSAEILIPLGASVILLILFYLWEKRISFSLLDLSLLKKKHFTFSVLSFLVIYILTNGMVFLFPFLLQWVKGFSVSEAGLLMAIPSVMQMLFGSLSGFLSDRINIRSICTAGMLLTLFSYILFIFLGPFSDIQYVITALVFFGVAIGTFIPANTNRIMSYAPTFEKGSVSSMMVTILRIGSALGVFLFATIFSFYVPQKNPIASGVNMDTIVNGFSNVFLIGAVISVIGVVFAFFSGDKNKEYEN
jgi:DHA2 family metal-tetracycline-proton antiporter-like MFS transporter